MRTPECRDRETGAYRVVKILAALMLVSSCSSPGYQAPLEDLQQPPSQKITTHTVARGETLYSIAWRYNLDVKKLAAVNKLDQRSTIYPGQRLTLDTSNASVPSSPTRSPRTSTTTRSRKAPAPAPASSPTVDVSRKLDWRWPARGPLLARFGGADALSKGIDIGAKKGEPVQAAESGTVVYAGNGLRGYGNLIILRHDNNYLSAYAHNSQLLAAEGDTVTMGQEIAEIGSSGTDRDKLHFEIRYNGKPVDPLRYLPKQ